MCNNSVRNDSVNNDSVKEIKRVAIIGAGAIGSYFIVGLSQKLGENLEVIAEGERRERLINNGIVVNGERIPLNVKTPEQAAGADLLIVAVKYGALKEIIPMVEKIIDDHTIVMSPLNGVESEEIIGSKIGMEHMVFSIMKISSQRVDNKINYNPDITMGVFFGEKDGSVSDRILAIQDLLEGSGVNYSICDDIERTIWYKYALNISRNIPQAIVNCEFGAYDTSEHVSYISKKMREEVVKVAAAKGIDISDENNPACSVASTSPKARFSTLQDLDAKRTTEIEMLSGALVRMGKELGIETPYNDFAYHTVKALEEKNSGKIS